MNFNPRKMKAVIFLCAAMLLAASLAGATVVPHKRSAHEQTQEGRPADAALPRIIRKVKDLQVVTATIKDQGKPNANAVVKIKNNSDKAVTAFTLTFGSASVGRDGGIDLDEPAVVIGPGRTTTVEIPLSNFEPDVPLILAAVVYADGTEDGQDVVLEMMHDQRAQAKAARDAKRKGEPQQ